MSDLPGLPIDPIEPPSGAYDGVARRARARRGRSALLAGGLALVVGAVGVGAAALTSSSTTAADDRLGPATAPPSATSESTPAPTATATRAATPTPTTTGAPRLSSPTLPPVPPVEGEQPNEDNPVVRGLVVDSAGKPIGGIYVYSLNQASLEQSADTRTGADGRFEVTCASHGAASTKVLVSSFALGPGRRPQPGPNYTFNWAGDGGRTYPTASSIPCRGAQDVGRIIMSFGSTITGRLVNVGPDGSQKPYADHAVPGFGLYCDEVLGFSGVQCADWDPVGGRYTFYGLSEGTYRLAGMYGSDTVRVAAQGTVQRDWYEGDCCPKGRAPSGQPTSSSPRPAATATPSPAASPA